MLADEIYAGAHAPAAIGWVAPVTLSLLLLASVWFVLSSKRQRESGARSAALTLGATWLLLHLLIGILFSPPGQPEVWMLALLPGWLLVVCLLVPVKGTFRPLVAVVIALFAHNLIGGLWVYCNPEGDRGRAKGGWLVENSRPEDAILTADSPVFARYLRYWAPAQVFDLQHLRNELRESWPRVQAAQGTVFATDDVFRPPAYYRVLRPVESDSLIAFGSEIQGNFSRVIVDEFGGVWELQLELELTGASSQKH
jgi:hypothetical protein